MSGKTVTAEMIKCGAYNEIVNIISPAAFVNEITVTKIIAYGHKNKTLSVGVKCFPMEESDYCGVAYRYIEFTDPGHTMRRINTNYRSMSIALSDILTNIITRSKNNLLKDTRK